MRGKHRVVVQNNKLHYEFEIKRNITIIQGDSATGKTTLIEMITQFQNLGASSGIEVICDVPCRTISGIDWKLILNNTHDSIVFLDEENSFINTKEFADIVSGSDNYFVIITRENLYSLPYSVEEIYGLRASGKYQNTNRIYQDFYNIYSTTQENPVEPEVVITEDSKSGCDFFTAVCEEKGKKCISADGKSNLFRLVKEKEGEEICVIADGAAIGPEMNRLYEQVRKNPKLKLYLPESFEWIILKSGIVGGKKVDDILAHPEDFIESQFFFSWERYFEKLLIEQTEGMYLQYKKAKLNDAYLHDRNKRAILDVLGEGNLKI